MAVVFENNDDKYQAWLNSNPSGFILSFKKTSPDKFMALHRGICYSISKYDKRHAYGAFTEGEYIKVCSDTIAKLDDWISHNLSKEAKITRRCKKCNPDDIDSFKKSIKLKNISDEEFSQSLVDSKNRTAEQRRERLSKSQKKPTQKAVITYVFNRNPDVVVEVLSRADGVCEQCNSKAPFVRVSDNTPYLEVHHEVPLAKGGDDIVENALALCPNCHREKHFGL